MGIFLVAWFLLLVIFVAVLTADESNSFQRWFGGSIGGLCLAVIVFYGLVSYSAWEELFRKNRELADQNDSLRKALYAARRAPPHTN